MSRHGFCRSARRIVCVAILGAQMLACHKEAPATRPANANRAPPDASDATLGPNSATPGASVSSPAAGAPSRTPPPDEVIRKPVAVGAGEKRPFILWLHGLGASGNLLRDVLHVDQFAERYKFAYSTPDGTLDSKQRRFWNAGPVCCDFDHQGVNHVARLTSILDQARAMPDIDARRLFVIGFSNGGFMAHRLACTKGSDLAGIASMAGLGPAPGEPCTPARALRVIEVHGGADVIVRPEGGRLFDDPSNPEHPALRATVDAWAKRNHCGTTAPSSQTIDLIPTLPGNETTQLAFAKCAADVELWTIAGGGHMSVNAPGVVQAVIQRLLR